MFSSSHMYALQLVAIIVVISASKMEDINRAESSDIPGRTSKMPKEFKFSENPTKVLSHTKNNVRHLKEKNITEETNEISDFHPKIINGRPAEEGEFPWMVALHYNDRYICSSSLISPTLVLTAAHCVVFENTAEPASAFYGIIGNLLREGPQTRLTFSELVAHPQYGSGSENDIAVFRVAERVQTSGLIKPICLPQSGREFENIYVQAIGWGVTSNENGAAPPENLMTTELQVPSLKACQFFFAFLAISITDKHVCANSYRSTGVCFGDSGGPLVYDDPMSGNNVQIGVASFVTFLGCGRPLVPNVYTATAAYVDWLTETVGENDICFV
nr:transmembrane protease serine 11B-like isoform X2 [Parasteatoda tepidariorum]